MRRWRSRGKPGLEIGRTDWPTVTPAREKLMDHWADEITEIADNQTLERRVKCDNRRWLMSKLAHRKYGDKFVHTGDPENPVQVLRRAVHLAPLTHAELEALDRLTSGRLKVIDG